MIPWQQIKTVFIMWNKKEAGDKETSARKRKATATHSGGAREKQQRKGRNWHERASGAEAQKWSKGKEKVHISHLLSHSHHLKP